MREPDAGRTALVVSARALMLPPEVAASSWRELDDFVPSPDGHFVVSPTMVEHVRRIADEPHVTTLLCAPFSANELAQCGLLLDGWQVIHERRDRPRGAPAGTGQPSRPSLRFSYPPVMAAALAFVDSQHPRDFSTLHIVDRDRPRNHVFRRVHGQSRRSLLALNHGHALAIELEDRGLKGSILQEWLVPALVADLVRDCDSWVGFFARRTPARVDLREVAGWAGAAADWLWCPCTSCEPEKSKLLAWYDGITRCPCGRVSYAGFDITDHPSVEVRWISPAFGARDDIADRLRPTDHADVRWARDLPIRKATPNKVPALGRSAELEAILAELDRDRPRHIIIEGASGVGCSALLSEVAEDVQRDGRTAWRVVRRPELETLRSLFAQAPAGAVILIDDLDALAMAGSGNYRETEWIQYLATALYETEAQAVMSLRPAGLETFRGASLRLVPAAMHLVVQPLGAADTRGALEQQVPRLIRKHRVRVEEAVLDALAAQKGDGSRAQPGLAIDLLDLAMSRAKRDGSMSASLRHLIEIDGGEPERTALPADLTRRLRRRIHGQAAAIEAIAERLVVGFSPLRANPEQPIASFLFTGPTGTGKSAVAMEIADLIYGSRDRFIRLDMSEYPDEYDVVKLFGIAAQYRHADRNTEALLTTKIRSMPQGGVLLLDEFEKADRVVQLALLQVFDAGTLTDGFGNVAQFGNWVIVATSNLGAAESYRSDDDTHQTLHRRVKAAVAEALPPELVGRLDVVPFVRLSAADAEAIASDLLAALQSRFTAQGYEVDFDPGALAPWIVARGFEPRLGARNLQRTIDTAIVSKVLRAGGKKLRLSIDGTGINAINGAELTEFEALSQRGSGD